MRILAFSDTHGSVIGTVNTIYSYDKVDAVIHAGDIARDVDKIRDEFPNMPIYAVCGNNDVFTDLPDKLLVNLGGKKIFVTHGHRYGVRMGNSQLKTLIAKNGYDLVIYGHTHSPEHDYTGYAQIINPGSALYRRTYAEIIIENGKLDATIRDIK